MIRLWFGFIIAVLCTGFGMQAARAELPRALFTVEAVAVDVSNPLPIRAREIAIANAQAIAFQRLIRRFVPEPEVGRIPLPNAAELERLAAAIEVVEEKSVTGRYVGRITVVFRPDEVRKKLKASGQIFSLTLGRPALIIAGGDSNVDVAALRRAIDGLPKGAWLEPPLAPIGESDADMNAAIGGDLPVLAAMVQRAGVSIAATVKVAADPPAVPTAPPGYSVSVQLYGADGNVITPRGQPTVFHIAPEPLDGTEGLWARLAHTAVDRVNEPWKRETAQDLSVSVTIDARAAYGSLSDWLAIRDALANSQSVTKMDIMELSTNSAQLSLTVAGTPDKLGFALAQRNVRLSIDGPVWRLSRMAGR
jgi:hypothetical protein